MRHRAAAGLLLVASLSACGGEKPPPAAETKAPPAPPAASDPTTSPAPAAGLPLPASVRKAASADTLKPMKGDTGGAKKAEGQLRDSAFGPKYTLDSTGKVRPIKRP